MTAVTHTETSEPRPLYVIAQDIRAHWKNVWFGAVPYLEALEELERITDTYGPGREDAKTLVIYFLNNAKTWRGEDAKRIKAELRKLVGLKSR